MTSPTRKRIGSWLATESRVRSYKYGDMVLSDIRSGFVIVFIQCRYYQKEYHVGSSRCFIGYFLHIQIKFLFQGLSRPGSWVIKGIMHSAWEELPVIKR